MQTSLKPEEDYLDEDKPFKLLVKKQNYCILSMLTPNAFPEQKRAEYSDQKILGIKVRGVFETYEDAKFYADKLQKQDKFHNIFVGEVGKWLPFNVDISTMQTDDSPVYREQALNQYMKAYKDCLKEEEIEEKERKEQTLKANNAKVVTGKMDAPDITGLGCPEIFPPGIIPGNKSNLNSESLTESENIDENSINDENNIDEQIKLSQLEKEKINKDLEDSKENIKELESKLATINEIYANLKK